MKEISVVLISDLHCGSVFGLTPKEYWEADPDRMSMQKESWEAYLDIVSAWKYPDFLCINADCIDGSQSKQGGAELTTPDRNIQVEMAVKCIEKWKARRHIMTYGSGYHVSSGAEDFEYNIANDEKIKATIGGRLYFEIDGIVWDMRHAVGASAIPHGRATPLLREVMWDLIKEAEATGPKVDIVVRSHVHYYVYVETGEKIALTTPALQLSRGRFGSRQCTGETHWGAVRFRIKNRKISGKDVILCKLHSNRPKLIRLA